MVMNDKKSSNEAATQFSQNMQNTGQIMSTVGAVIGGIATIIAVIAGMGNDNK